jgi:hypothetical protein
VRREVVKTDPLLAKPEWAVTVVRRRRVGYGTEHSPDDSFVPLLRVLKFNVYAE